MSKYGTGESKYCYPGTDVLINHFDIRDEEQLQRFDAMLSSKRLAELALRPLDETFDFAHLRRIHAWIFQDLYPFAGKVREENISKDGFTFAPRKHIEPSALTLFVFLRNEPWHSFSKRKLARKLAHYFAEINVLHPFRDGNGRASREFIRCLAASCGYSLNWADGDKDEILKASIQSVTDPKPLEEVLYRLLKK
ncbi:Fic/DOC family protein [Alkalicoccus halolimnae]|uniref:protein adenylyltransferase n=1 Tax=Alkalicoccus halolimnae TaxID=1667239 RepID=A0A5C7F298_9BACI|nr:Fic family protein [Alkalicoccus halolimnae]TXF84009.1 cell filamentation protein Fic [Alkalicoccus halolimnae]